jgi:hypothetical protein
VAFVHKANDVVPCEWGQIAHLLERLDRGDQRVWVQDFWHNNYEGAPLDGSAWLQGGDPSLRAVRGGSWINNPLNLRAASRIRNSTYVRFNSSLASGLGGRLPLNSLQLYIFTSWVGTRV